MNKKLLAAIVGIAILVLGAVAYVAMKPSDEVESNQTATTTTQQTTETKSEPTADRTGVYTDYSADKVSSTSGTKLVFFYAPWCPQCRSMDDDIKANGLPAGVTVLKADYDSNQALRQKYGVTIQTTFVKIDDNGDKVASYVSYEEPKFSSVERELLP